MLRIDWLEKQMDKCDLMAEWLYREFSYEFAQQSLTHWQHEFSTGQGDGSWKCLIATEQGQLLGGASLASNDLPARPELGPWLACVYIAPEARPRGLAAQLIEGICCHAKEAGFTTLYLHTHNQSQYYAKLGWEVLERFEAWGKEQSLMFRSL
ncbi:MULTISPECIES: GNAT family N-acetyltransferase [Pseudomonas]|uniref:GNAT family N-acetyltransferase n=1 Tax=Pseudomonas TaxID=286 RepID=UPI001BEC5536|nr:MULTISPECIES: GNAT family N-acetyltransferase [Pseudomonas]MBT2338690.1 GNAT family N-acetyltransferase [Pseudomonas fluorescens]MCD4530564.1 GNAT family N-acetyltransferase [Pseudomonas sp. C3-2018]